MTPVPTTTTLPSVAVIKRLQNDIRRAVNCFPPGDNQRRLGADSALLRSLVTNVVGPPHASHLNLRRRRAAEYQEEYAVSYDGHLLFRLIWVPWPDTDGGRWHVRRHPDATWWRTTAKSRPTQPKRRSR